MPIESLDCCLCRGGERQRLVTFSRRLLFVRSSRCSLCQQLCFSFVVHFTHVSNEAIPALGHRLNKLVATVTFAKCLAQHRDVLVDVAFLDELVRRYGTHQ